MKTLNIPNEYKPEFDSKLDTLRINANYILIHRKKEYIKNGIKMSEIPKFTKFEVIMAGKEALKEYPDIIGAYAFINYGQYPTQKIDGEEYMLVPSHEVVSYNVV